MLQKEGLQPSSPFDVIKSQFISEFAGIPQRRRALALENAARERDYYRCLMFPVIKRHTRSNDKGKIETYVIKPLSDIRTTQQAQETVILASFYDALMLTYRSIDEALLPQPKRDTIREYDSQAKKEWETVFMVTRRGQWKGIKEKWLGEITPPQWGDGMTEDAFRKKSQEFSQFSYDHNLKETERILALVPDDSAALDLGALDPYKFIGLF